MHLVIAILMNNERQTKNKLVKMGDISQYTNKVKIIVNGLSVLVAIEALMI